MERKVNNSQDNLSEVEQAGTSLNDVATLLVLLEPTDPSSFDIVREALKDIEASSTDPVQKFVSEAVQKIDAITQGKASDPDSIITDIGRLVEAAIDAMEDSEQGIPTLPIQEEPSHEPIIDIADENHPADESPDDADIEPTEEESFISLSDVAELLAELDSTDQTQLGFLRDMLNDIAASSPAQQYITEAVQKIDDITQGKASDPDSIIADVNRLVKSAINVTEGSEQGEVTAPPTTEPIPEESALEQEEIPEPLIESAAEGQQSYALPDDADLELLGDFLTESSEMITDAEAALLTLETDPDDMEAVDTVFRAFHTVKGTSSFLELNIISELTHNAETFLNRIRDKEIRCTGGYADLALRSVDMLKELIQIVQDALGGEPIIKPEGYDDLMGYLKDPEAVSISSESETSKPPRVGDILVAQGKAERQEVEAAAIDQGEQLIGEVLVKSETSSLTDVAQALRVQKRMAGGEQATESSVRVRTDRLDRLIDTVGELVISHSIVAQDEIVVGSDHLDLLKKVNHTSKIVRELQDLTMSMRMIPLKPTFQKMARLVRDLARKNDKMVNFVTEGEDTEIDRNMVDKISDPLVHMVRNAVDHGIEPPDVREEKGKPKAGVVRLAAYHSGGSVVVEVQDDGKGLSRDKIVKKAISKGLIQSDKGMSNSEVFNLIFAPGFSTAEKVTDVSGRGVGLDVVKKGVESLRGRIDISSLPGKGCTFVLRMPLTLAITDGMLVKVGTQRYIVPTINIHLSFRPNNGDLPTLAGRGEMVMLREELMPMFRLHRLFDVKDAVEEPTEGLLVVVDDGDRRCALLVDELLGQQQVVAKSLGDGIGKIQGVAGGAILGDGCVGLILDPSEITLLARQT